MSEQQVIKFTAEIIQVTTRTDFGVRLVLDLPENQSKALNALIEAYQYGALLEIAAVPVKPEAGS